MTSNASDTAQDPKHINRIVPKIQNVVATCNLVVQIDLTELTLKVRNAEYNPRRHPAVVVRIRHSKSTALVHASGRMVVIGTKSEDDARLAARKYARLVRK